MFDIFDAPALGVVARVRAPDCAVQVVAGTEGPALRYRNTVQRPQCWLVPGLVGCRPVGPAVGLVVRVVVQVFEIFDAPALGVVMRLGRSGSASDSVVQVDVLLDTPALRAAMGGSGQCGTTGRVVLRRVLDAVGLTAAWSASVRLRSAGSSRERKDLH